MLDKATYPKRKEEVIPFNGQLEIIEQVQTNNSKSRLNSNQFTNYNQSRYNNQSGGTNYQGGSNHQQNKYALAAVAAAAAVQQQQKYYPQGLYYQQQQLLQLQLLLNQQYSQHHSHSSNPYQQQGNAQYSKYDYSGQFNDYGGNAVNHNNNVNSTNSIPPYLNPSKHQALSHSLPHFFNESANNNSNNGGNGNLSTSSSLISETNAQPPQPYDFKNLFMLMNNNNSNQSLNSPTFNAFNQPPVGKVNSGGSGSTSMFLDKSNSPVLIQPQHTTTSSVGALGPNSSPPSMLLSTPVSAGSLKSGGPGIGAGTGSASGSASGFLTSSPALLPSDTWSTAAAPNNSAYTSSIWGTAPTFSNSSTITTLAGSNVNNSSNNNNNNNPASASTTNFGGSSLW